MTLVRTQYVYLLISFAFLILCACLASGRLPYKRRVLVITRRESKIVHMSDNRRALHFCELHGNEASGCYTWVAIGVEYASQNSASPRNLLTTGKVAKSKVLGGGSCLSALLVRRQYWCS